MSFDISHVLNEWPYQPGEIQVRRFKGKDGCEKIQLRVDVGLLQMNGQGRPDGKRPFGRESLLEHHHARLERLVVLVPQPGQDQVGQVRHVTSPRKTNTAADERRKTQIKTKDRGIADTVCLSLGLVPVNSILLS
jgi:hypothetical protein